MKDRIITLSRALGHAGTAGLWVASICLVFMTAAIAAQVFWRYVLNDSLVWTEPASVMIMGWFIFLGAAVGIREGYHLSFDVLLYALPEAGRKVCYLISDLFVTAFGVGMTYYGFQLAEKAAGNTLPALGISGAFDFAPLVFGGVLVILFSLERILRLLAGLPIARFGDDPIED